MGRENAHFEWIILAFGSVPWRGGAGLGAACVGASGSRARPEAQRQTGEPVLLSRVRSIWNFSYVKMLLNGGIARCKYVCAGSGARWLQGEAARARRWMSTSAAGSGAAQTASADPALSVVTSVSAPNLYQHFPKRHFPLWLELMRFIVIY